MTPTKLSKNAEKARMSSNQQHIAAINAYNKVAEEITESQGATKKPIKPIPTDDDLSNARQAAERAEKADNENKLKLASAEKAQEQCRRDFESAEAKADGAVRRVAKTLLGMCSFATTDQVSRARFFFTWIGAFIRYSKAVHEKNYYRHAVVTLTNGYEVCDGYAKLFSIMFNTSSTGALITQDLRCEVISGHAKQKPEDYLPEDGRKDRAHAWVAFPIPRTGSLPLMKVCMN
jgi:transglutaminase/protease-like cytokinesis protein 3